MEKPKIIKSFAELEIILKGKLAEPVIHKPIKP